ncbi:MAG: adenylate/guanylate cyclase domain-containing protein [Oscillatoriales cyanobacterium RM2_1_1]|nr:adenylate/guanylate cyclase domain-containing protein [Oscillatoriales cyanobacterium SM2_3_0]NJO45270.1 adenylate/guanylate cyclase domain-containing protein [Oscillatoriales cyanobacterium RM2_1_1]
MDTKGGVRSLLWRWRGVWITTPSIAALIILLRLTGILQFWEWGAYDTYLRYRPYQPPENRIVIVGIDEADLQKVGQALIPDGVYAELLKKLREMQPRAIGLNIYRDLPVPPGHEDLVKVFQTTPNLVGIQKVVGDERQDTIAPPPLLAARGLVGASDLILDTDYRVRRGLLYLTDDQDQTIFSFGFLVALLYLEGEGITPETIEGTNRWQLGQEVFVPLNPNDGGYVKADTQGYQLLLNYQGAQGHFDVVSLSDVLDGRVSADWGRDKIILIGAVGESLSDLFATPYSGGWLTYLEPMAGVEIQAHLANQIISAAKGKSALIRTWSDLQEMAWIVLWSGIGALLAWQGRYTYGKLFSTPQLLQLLIATVILFLITYTAFLRGWWIPVVPPVLAMSSSALAITGYMAHKAGLIRETFGRYLSNEVVAQLLESQDHATLEARRQLITILISDIRGFTVLAEHLTPEDVVHILNIYLEHMSALISRYQGTIDKYTGDGIVVLFGAPTPQHNDAQRALACAIAMQIEMERVNQQLKVLNFPTMEMGIGINTGEAVVGNIGSTEHIEYTAIGYEMNLAFQVENCTMGGQILISEATQETAGSVNLRIDGEKQIIPRGTNRPMSIYEIGGIGEPYNLFLPKESNVLFPLKTELPIQYSLLEGKQTTNIFFEAYLTQLSLNSAEIRIDPIKVALMPPLQGDIKLRFSTLNDQGSGNPEVYGKVIKNISSQKRFHVRFTFKPPVVESYLNLLYQSLQG